MSQVEAGYPVGVNALVGGVETAGVCLFYRLYVIRCVSDYFIDI
jgi:hypothetical protein